MPFKDISYLKLWRPSCSAEWNLLCNFVEGVIRSQIRSRKISVHEGSLLVYQGFDNILSSTTKVELVTTTDMMACNVPHLLYTL